MTTSEQSKVIADAPLPNPNVHRILRDNKLYGRPLAYDSRGEGPYGLPYLNNGPLPLDDAHVPEWHAFVGSEECFHQRLCMYCGTRMRGPVVLVRYRYSSFETSGPGCHPTCALYAVRTCPHITRDPEFGLPEDVIAYAVVGETGVVVLMNDDGTPAVELTFTDGTNDVVDYAVPITLPQLKTLAREYPER